MEVRILPREIRGTIQNLLAQKGIPPLMQWRSLKSCPLPILRDLHQRVQILIGSGKLVLPISMSDCLYIASDYAGDHSASAFQTFTSVFADFESWKDWELKRQIHLRYLLPDGRGMSFKKLNDQFRQNALEPFLEAAGQLNGVCVTFAIHKEVGDFLCSKDALEIYASTIPLEANWKSQQFRRMLHIVHLNAFLLASLSQPGQEVIWITDQDNFVANPSFQRDAVQILGSISGAYVAHVLGKLQFGLSSLDEGLMDIEHYLAIPDLVAGALAQVLTTEWKESNGRIGHVLRPMSENLPAKTSEILAWLAVDSEPLKRLTIVLRRDGAGLRIHILRFIAQ